jgi:hypothetical protein
MIVLVYSWVEEGAQRSTEVLQFSSERKLEEYVNKTMLGLPSYEILFCAEYTTEIEFREAEKVIKLQPHRIDPAGYRSISAMNDNIRGL